MDILFTFGGLRPDLKHSDFTLNSKATLFVAGHWPENVQLL